MKRGETMAEVFRTAHAVALKEKTKRGSSLKQLPIPLQKNTNIFRS